MDRIDSLMGDIGKDEVKATWQMSSLRAHLQRYMKEDPDGYKRREKLTPLEDQLLDLYHDYLETNESLSAKRNKLENLMKQALEED